MGRLECMTVNYPPTFNPNNEKIIEIEEKGSSITVKSDVLYAGMESQRLYKFKKQAGLWKIDNVKEIQVALFILMAAYAMAEAFMSTGVGASLILIALKVGITAKTVAVIGAIVTSILSIENGTSWAKFEE